MAKHSKLLFNFAVVKQSLKVWKAMKKVFQLLSLAVNYTYILVRAQSGW